jgi:hypothetical protein
LTSFHRQSPDPNKQHTVSRSIKEGSRVKVSLNTSANQFYSGFVLFGDCSEMVAIGSGQGRSDVETAGVDALR